MKKLIAFSSVALLLPGLVLAAAPDDVSLGSNTVLSVGSATINVTSATIPSIDVGASSFDVTLAPGSTMTVSTSGGKQLTYSSTAYLTANACDSSGSSFTMTVPSGDATTTITVTPTSTTCGSSSSSSSSSSGGGGGAPVGLIGGGGGGGSGTTILPSTPASTPVPTPAATSGAGMQQILALVAQLKSLIAIYQSLGGTVTPEMNAMLNAFPAASSSFDRDLEVGMTGDDVMALQVYLNSHGYQLASSGPGSPGNETTKFGGLTRDALAKLQAANGITPSVGYFGPKTRAFVNANP